MREKKTTEKLTEESDKCKLIVSPGMALEYQKQLIEHRKCFDDGVELITFDIVTEAALMSSQETENGVEYEEQCIKVPILMRFQHAEGRYAKTIAVMGMIKFLVGHDDAGGILRCEWFDPETAEFETFEMFCPIEGWVYYATALDTPAILSNTNNQMEFMS